MGSVGSLRLSRSASAIGASVFAELAPRIEARLRGGEDLVELHIGDTHRAPPAVARFGHLDPDAFDPSLYRYGSVSGLESLKDAFAQRLRASSRGPADVDGSSGVLVAAGATHAIFCAARAVLDPGDEVLVAAPYWPLSVGVLRSAGAVPIEVPLTNRLYEDPSADAAAIFAAAITPRTRALYFITPNNPDGKVLSESQVAGIARLARERGLWVFADEVYADYVYDGVHASIARQPGMAEQTLSFHSLSKSHALPGTRVGFAVGPARVIATARRVATHTVFNVPVAAQRLALAAIQDSSPWAAETLAAFRSARDAALVALRPLESVGITARAPDGGTYVFLDFTPVLRARGAPGTSFALLERAVDRGVLLTPGHAFGAAFASWARLCFTSVSEARLVEGIARLRAAVGDL